jgi:hypothetical protein
MRLRFSTDVAILPRLTYPMALIRPRVSAADCRRGSGSAWNGPRATWLTRCSESLAWNLSDIGASLMGFTDDCRFDEGDGHEI